MNQHQKHFTAVGAEAALRGLFQRAFLEFPVYRRRFEENGLAPNDDPTTILDRMPAMSTDDYLSLERDILGRIKSRHFLTDYTSGTTGPRRIRFTTARDDRQEEALCIRFFRQCGLGQQDRVLALDIDSADIHLFYGSALQQVGVEEFMYASVPSTFDCDLTDAKAWQPTVFLSIPSVIARCYEELKAVVAAGVPLTPRKLIYFGEPMSQALRRRLSSELGLEVFSFYGSTEIGSMAGECRAHNGIHLYNDVVIPTIVNAIETGDEVTGEVVWTTPEFLDQPLIKFATRDYVTIAKSPCPCGLAYPLMTSIRRTAEQFTVYGHKFMYEAFERGLTEEVGELEFLQIRLQELGTREEIIFILPDELRPRAPAIQERIAATDEMEYFTRHGFVQCHLEFRAMKTFRERKLARIVDRRPHTAA